LLGERDKQIANLFVIVLDDEQRAVDNVKATHGRYLSEIGQLALLD
jgi:hypothetical protein